jgi:hypothetical protein
MCLKFEVPNPCQQVLFIVEVIEVQAALVIAGFAISDFDHS